MDHQTELPTRRTGLNRLALRILLIVALVVALHFALTWISDRAVAAGSHRLMFGMLALVLFGYALLIAVPFMPGIEIGISLLILQGADIAPFVYLATVLGLTLAFGAGRLMPYAWIHALLRDLRWKSACDFVERLEPMDHEARLAHLTGRLPEWARVWVKAGRYVLLAALLNVPGNAVLGGGGGIAFVAGLSRLFRPSITLVVLLLAVLPVPLAVWLSGVSVLF